MEEINYAELTDDELMNIDDSGFKAIQDKPTESSEKLELTDDTNGQPTKEKAQDEEIKPQESISEDKDELQIEKEENQKEEDQIQEEVKEVEEVAGKENITKEDSDFRAETLAPLKANGKELKINSVQELRNLASMGANYSLKMQKIKPHLKLLKTLDKYNLLEEDKINYLISLTKGDKGAISKLLADSNIDPDYMDLPESSDYKANDYTIPDSELILDEVLENIKYSEHYPATMEILGNVWDEQSRSVIAANPQSIKTIHDHIANGMYAKIWDEVERQRMLGNLTTQSDVEAYDIVGEAMQEQGMFNPTTESNTDSKRKAKRKAAGSTKNSGSIKKKEKPSLSEFDIFNMTDEEIEALVIPGIT